MLTIDQTNDLFARVKRYSSADEVEVLIGGGSSALTRFANNTIHQNVAEENYVASIRASFGQRTARATTNKLDDEGLRRAVQSAESIARVQQPNPDMLPMASAAEVGSPAPAPSRYFEQSAAITPQGRAAS